MSFRPFRSLPVLCATACLLSQCKKGAPPAAGPTGEVLATVAGRPLTEKDLLEEAAWRKSRQQAVPTAPELLTEMVHRLAMVERAQQAGLAEDPETRRRIESLLISRLREKELEAALARVEVSDEELAASYQARQQELTRPGLDRFAILFQAADEKMSAARRQESRQRLEAAIALADANPAPGGRGPAASGFGPLAADYSEDQASRYRGGDIGWIGTDAGDTRWPAAVLAAGRALEKAGRSGIIESPTGYHVIMKTDSRPGGTPPLAEVADTLRQGLLREKCRALEEQFVADALRLAKAEIDSTAAARITLPDSAAPAAPAAPPAFPTAPPSSSR